MKTGDNNQKKEVEERISHLNTFPISKGEHKELTKIPEELTYNYLMSLYHPFKIAKTLSNINTVEDSLEANTPSIALIKRYNGEDLTTAFIELHLVTLISMINVTRPLNEFQVKEISRMIVAKYWNLTISDINLLFDRVKLGYFKIFETLSVHVILGWFKIYFDERCSVAENRSLRNHDKLKYKEEKGGGEAFVNIWQEISEEKRQALLSDLGCEKHTDKKEKEEGFKKFYIDYISKKADKEN